MNLDQLERKLQNLDVPVFATADHQAKLGAVLRRHQSARPARRLLRAPGALGLLALCVGAATTGGVAYWWSITQTTAWGELSNFDDAPTDQVEPQYRDELQRLWTSGAGRIVNKRIGPHGEIRAYEVEFTFSDGAVRVLQTVVPPDCALRRELQRLMADGAGTTIDTLVSSDGDVTYINAYRLSNGDLIRVGDGFPPLNPAQRLAAQQYINRQESRVVGRRGDQYVCAYDLPDGRVFTQIQDVPRFNLTSERQAEIFAQQTCGEGTLVQHIFTPEADVYRVEYRLSDGSVFRVGQEHPPMSLEQLAQTQRELQDLYHAGQFEHDTETTSDGQSVAVLRFETSQGTITMVDSAQMRSAWGIDE